VQALSLLKGDQENCEAKFFCCSGLRNSYAAHHVSAVVCPFSQHPMTQGLSHYESRDGGSVGCAWMRGHHIRRVRNRPWWWDLWWPFAIQTCPRAPLALYLMGRFALLSGNDSSDRTISLGSAAYPKTWASEKFGINQIIIT
jgi:hypothetical protein